jgi:LysR family cys regulon transcriptional activator
MKLQQLRYLVAIHDNGLSITAAARHLHASQPEVSRQLKLLEEEVGLPLFERSGRTLTRTTVAGEDIIGRADRIMREVHQIRQTSADLRRADGGTLAIATTQMQARYVLPEVIRTFRIRYPRVRLHLHQGTAEQIAEMVAQDRVDFAIASGPGDLFPRLVRLPVYRWRSAIVLPRGHSLATVPRVTRKRLAAYPIITYVVGIEAADGLFDVALTADDAEVIKAYVRLGLGVGIIAGLALDAGDTTDLVCRDAPHLFHAQTAWIGFRRRALLRAYLYDFIELLAPHLDRKLVREAEQAAAQDDVDRLCRHLPIPLRDRTAAH